jgi:hypothetical protein
MRLYHLHYFPPIRPTIPDSIATVDQTPAQPKGYGLFERAVAEQANAHDGDKLTVAHSEPGLEAAYIASLAPAARSRYMVIYSGGTGAVASIPFFNFNVIYGTGGCVAQARREKIGSASTAVALNVVPQLLNRQLDQSYSSEPAFLRALGKWRSCMNQGGIPAADPAGLIGSLTAAFTRYGPTTEMRVQEQRTSELDSHCDHASQLRATTLFLRAQAYLRLPRQVQQAVKDLAVRRKRALAMLAPDHR